MDTQRARYQANYNGDWQWTDDLTKVWGKHTTQFGVQLHMLPYTHVRADKVLGSIASLVATVDGDQGFISIPSSERPPTCGGSVTTGCILSANLTNWDRYYASVLGMVDNVGVLAVRDSNLNPLPLGTFLVNHTNEWATYFYAHDIWRITNSLTLTYGLSYGWQTSPTESQNRQTIMIDASNGQPISAAAFLQNKLNSALAGQVYNPTVGFEPVSNAHRSVYNVDWGDVAPRVAFAWNPSFLNGLFGKLLGERKMVIRGGFSMVYDRSNTVQSVEIPMLGVGFDQNISVNAPPCNVTGQGGAGCVASAGANAPGLSSYRVGVDGTIPLPTPTSATSPVIPASPFSEALSFQVDPNTKIGRSYNVDLSIQRQLGGGVLLEAAYVGRFARRLPQAVNLASSPYMFVDSASGQSFAQAFDAVATALRAGAAPATQPWFENQLPGLAKLQGSASATAYVANQLKSSFVNGNVSTIFQNLGNYRRSLGLLPYNNDQAQMEFMRTYIGQSNYNSAIVSVNKRFSRGLNVSANYTYAKTLDDDLSNQNNASYYPNSLHPGVDYGPSTYDRRHVFNAFYTYDLPAGKGHMFRTGTAFDKVLEGWYTSGIASAWTGLPLIVTESSQTYGGGITLGANTGAIPTGPLPSTGLNSGIGPASGCGSNGSGAHGSGLNLFSNPAAACAGFRPVLLSQDSRDGRANPLRGLPFKNIDMRFGKRTTIHERFSTEFSADFFNIFNHPNFANPALSLTNPAAFGVITSTYTPPNRTNSARWIELGLRVQF
jgi:hypothetical protein